MSVTMGVRLEPDREQRPDRLAEATQRSKSFLTSREMKEVLGKWGVDAGWVARQ